MKNTIKKIIAEAILDGQNQAHDLHSGKATPEQITNRMSKSLEFHFDRLKKVFNEEHIEDGSECWCKPKVVRVSKK